jgi:hypothetical protein
MAVDPREILPLDKRDLENAAVPMSNLAWAVRKSFGLKRDVHPLLFLCNFSRFAATVPE